VRLGVANGDMRVAPGMTAGSAEIPMSRIAAYGVRMLYVLAAKAPTYQAKANLFLANSPAPPTAPTPTWEPWSPR
jgi:hypothetical protein